MKYILLINQTNKEIFGEQRKWPNGVLYNIIP